MPTALTEKQRNKAVGRLRNAYPKIKLEWGTLVHRDSSLWLFMELYDCAVHKDFERWLGEYPLVSFVPARIQAIARCENLKDAERGPTDLLEFELFRDAEAISNRIIDEFASLPWRYSVSAVLPLSATKALAPLRASKSLSEDHRVLLPADNWLRHFPLDTGSQTLNQRIHETGLIGLLELPKWSEEKAVFQVEVDGFIGPFGQGLAFETASDQLKAFCGLGIALRLFKATPVYMRDVHPVPIYVHRKSNDAWTLESKIDAPAELSRALGWLAMLDVPGTDEEHEAHTRNSIAGISVPFKAGPDGQRILLAARWLFEGYTGHDDLLNFVQCMIVLEILLGDSADKSEASLSSILATRCAYAIADTRKERDELEKEFRELYRLRSKIVHTGHARLNAEERAHLNSLRILCGRVLRREVILLQAEIAEQQKAKARDTFNTNDE